MLTYLSGSIWASPAQTLVNTVNVVRRRHPSKLEGQRGEGQRDGHN